MTRNSSHWYRLILSTVLAVLATGTVRADERPNALKKATSFALNRIVKVYGAKVGRTPGYATGLIISDKGEILTANGTYLNGERIRVILPDGSSHVAKAQRRSRADQLAILKIDLETKQYFDLSKPSAVYKGQWIVAVLSLIHISEPTRPY